MVGLPSSGKTTRAREIQKYFSEQLHKEVVLISDNEIISQMALDKNDLFLGKYTHDLFTICTQLMNYFNLASESFSF